MTTAIQAYHAAIEQCDAAEGMVTHYRRALDGNPTQHARAQLAYAKKLHQHRTRMRQRAYVAALRADASRRIGS